MSAFAWQSNEAILFYFTRNLVSKIQFQHHWDIVTYSTDIYGMPSKYARASLVAQLVKNPPAMQETWIRSLGWEDPLEKGKTTHSSILAWRIARTIQSMGSQRVGHDWMTFSSTFWSCSLIWPIPLPPFSLATASFQYLRVCFCHVICLFCLLDFTYKWNHMAFVFLCLTYQLA